MRGSLGLHFLGRVWDSLRGRHGRGHLVARLARLGQHIIARVKVLALLHVRTSGQESTKVFRMLFTPYVAKEAKKFVQVLKSGKHAE
jgi:hypothetical protein